VPIVHNKVIITGAIGTSEVWQTGVAFTGASISPEDIVNSQDDLNDWCNAIAAAFLPAVYSNIRGVMSTVTTVNKVQCQFRAGSQLVLQSAPFSTPVFAGSGTQFNPPQTAVVASLLTNSPGSSNRGRMYWPATGVPFSSTMKVPNTAGIADHTADLIEMFRTQAPIPGMRPCIFSPTYDKVTPVTRIRVGDVADTQRRRRDNLVETYAEVII
jgi:hypothetical protein